MVNIAFAPWDALIVVAFLTLQQSSYLDDVAISPPSYIGSLDLATELARGSTVVLPCTSAAMRSVALEMVESLRRTALLVQALQGLTGETSRVPNSTDSAFSRVVGAGRPDVEMVAEAVAESVLTEDPEEERGSFGDGDQADLPEGSD